MQSIGGKSSVSVSYLEVTMGLRGLRGRQKGIKGFQKVYNGLGKKLRRPKRRPSDGPEVLGKPKRT